MSLGTIYQSIEILSKEKGIDPQIIVDAVKDAMLVAARKHFHTEEDLVAEFDKKTGAIQIFIVKKVVETIDVPLNQLTLEQARAPDPAAEIGTEIRIPRATALGGGFAAQPPRGGSLQKAREAGRETVYQEFSGRVGELVNCTVKRVEGPDLVVDIGKTEARLPKKEQSRLESFSVGDRVRCVIKSVEKTGKNPGVIVSRAVPELVVRLFEQEVPEIYDSTVTIKACAREAGERTKIAVQSRDRDVDSVGACVGMKGMRVQSIIRELRGEKIDIIEFSDDSISFAQKALSPAKVTRVQIIDPEEKRLEVIVEDTQLSLAIGKKGQNVRLASKLSGWNIDIKSEEEKRREIEAQMAALTAPGTPLTELIGVGPKTVEKLEAAGITSVEKLADMTPEQLVEIPGIGEKMVEKIHQSVAAYFEALEAQALAAPEQSAETLEAGGAGTAESPEKPEGPGEVQETPEAGEPPEAPEVGEAPEISEEPETG